MADKWDFAGGIALGIVIPFALLFVAAAMWKLQDWWQNREVRRWPTVDEWQALQDAVSLSSDKVLAWRHEQAATALRKLRYRQRRKTDG